MHFLEQIPSESRTNPVGLPLFSMSITIFKHFVDDWFQHKHDGFNINMSDFNMNMIKIDGEIVYLYYLCIPY